MFVSRGVVTVLGYGHDSWIRRGCLAWLGVLICISSARGQIPQLQQINPGAIENEIRRQQEQLERRTAPPRQQGPAVIGPARQTSPLLQPGGPRFLLKAIQFGESKFLTKQELDAVTAPYVGKRIDFSDLQSLIAAINALYQTKGMITGIATLPPQQVTGGVVRIQLTEGRLGRTSIEGRVQTSEGYITRRVPLPKPGEVLDVPEISRQVIWFNRTNDVQIRTLLQPGTTFGLTDVQLAIIEPPVNTLQYFFDNQGVLTTGRYQNNLYYRRHGTLGIDDRFTFYGTRSEGNLNGNVSYNVPFNPAGGRIGGSYTQGKIRIIKGPFAELDVTGTSQQSAANLTQPVYAAQSWLVLINSAYTQARTTSDFGSTTTTDDEFEKITGGVAVSSFGDYHTLTFAPAYNRVESYSHVFERKREFELYTGTWSGFLKMPADFSFTLLGSGQYAHNVRLLPGDQLFQIGGPTTVRGYPTGAAAGDSGYYTNFELHRDLTNVGAKGVDVFVFHDRGEVYSVNPKVRKLWSLGGGFSWLVIPPLTIEASAGRPMTQVVENQRSYQAYFRVTFRPLLIPGLMAALGLPP